MRASSVNPNSNHASRESSPTRQTHLHIAIPAMDEMEYLPCTLQSIERSVFSGKSSSEPILSVYICINQPDEWWDDTAEHRRICESNAALLRALDEYPIHHPITIIDRSSKGNGWTGKNYGVGWARKVLFDHILNIAAPDDIIVSMDSDTEFGPHYLQSIIENLAHHPQWVALSVPYYHRLTSNDVADKAILQYEIYMRNYALNMLHIESPYAFTAIGSAIAVRAGALRKIGGLTPVKSGEDFYLLQKLTKMGIVGSWNTECVYPAARFSDRVFFGTGPAMSKAALGDLSSYPLYHHTLFGKVKETYDRTEELYLHDIHTEFLDFLQLQFKQKNLWEKIRRNVKNAGQFKRAFHEKADGLRILQFLKQKQKTDPIPDILSLSDNLMLFLTDPNCSDEMSTEIENTLSVINTADTIQSLSIPTLDTIRNTMRKLEMALRRNIT